jgi:hypothetical protein
LQIYTIPYFFQSQSPKRHRDPYKPNAFAVMLAAQNELQLPPKPVGEKLSGPQRLLSDIITWISNFDKGWTKDVLETGSVVCKKFSNALWFRPLPSKNGK